MFAFVCLFVCLFVCMFVHLFARSGSTRRGYKIPKFFVAPLLHLIGFARLLVWVFVCFVFIPLFVCMFVHLFVRSGSPRRGYKIPKSVVAPLLHMFGFVGLLVWAFVCFCVCSFVCLYVHLFVSFIVCFVVRQNLWKFAAPAGCP